MLETVAGLSPVTSAPGTRADRLADNWVYGGALAGVMLLCLTPALTAGWPAADVLIFLTLPVYMIHQYEEHDADRFRHFMNATMAGGREAMTRRAVFVINVFGVWAPLALCVALTRSGGPGFGVFAGWLLLVNALLHAAPALRMRRYNPGLVTALLLFLPLGAAVLASAWALASPAQVWTGLALAIALHAAIIIHMKRRIAQF